MTNITLWLCLLFKIYPKFTCGLAWVLRVIVNPPIVFLENYWVRPSCALGMELLLSMNYPYGFSSIIDYSFENSSITETEFTSNRLNLWNPICFSQLVDLPTTLTKPFICRVIFRIFYFSTIMLAMNRALAKLTDKNEISLWGFIGETSLALSWRLCYLWYTIRTRSIHLRTSFENPSVSILTVFIN